jgi:hypothetical protein
MNHKASIGENMDPILLVPNFCMLNKATRTIIETVTTVSANNHRLNSVMQNLNLFISMVFTRKIKASSILEKMNKKVYSP